MEARKGKKLPGLFQYTLRIFKITLVGVFVLSTLFLVNQFKLSRSFPIKNVHVYGANRVAHQELQDLLMPLVNQGFFGIEVDNIRDHLLQMPWVADIFVRRNWPDQVDITIIEKNAVASWNAESLLSEAGELFEPGQTSYPANLPLFIGPAGQQIVMLKYYKDINRILMPLHAKISYLELTPYLTWKMKLDNGISLQVGHKDILTRLGHFVKVYPKIVGEHVGDVESMDLRYPNGVAVRWKTVLKT